MENSNGMAANFLVAKSIVTGTIAKAWDCFVNPGHVVNWNFAGDDWHCPKSEATVETGGRFCHTMAAKDGSFSFDFFGDYTSVEPLHALRIVLGDGRKMEVDFKDLGDGTVEVIERFEPENQNPLEMQQQGWQMILNRYAEYASQL